MQNKKWIILLIAYVGFSACGQVQQGVVASAPSLPSPSAFAPAPRIDIFHRADGPAAKAATQAATQAAAQAAAQATLAPDDALSLASRTGGDPDFVSATVDVASDRHGCMGTLIAENLVLTAAHCLYYKGSGERAPDSAIKARLSKNSGWIRAKRTATLKTFRMPVSGEHTTYETVAADVAVIELLKPLSARARAIPLSDGGAATVLIPGLSARAATPRETTARVTTARVTTAQATKSRGDATTSANKTRNVPQARASSAIAAPSCNRSNRVGPISLYDCVAHHGDSGSGVWSAPRAGQSARLIGVVSSIAGGGVAVVDAVQAQQLVATLRRR